MPARPERVTHTSIEARYKLDDPSSTELPLHLKGYLQRSSGTSVVNRHQLKLFMLVANLQSCRRMVIKKFDTRNAITRRLNTTKLNDLNIAWGSPDGGSSSCCCCCCLGRKLIFPTFDCPASKFKPWQYGQQRPTGQLAAADLLPILR